MYFVTFIVISVSSLCYLQTTEASCNRTLLPTKLVTTTTTTTTDGITINDSPITHSTNDIAANLNYDSRNDSKQFDNSNHRLETEAQEYSPHELNSLRLEFNKYKILSHLGITTNPDLLEPNLSAEYRHRLLSSEAVQKLRSAANVSRHSHLSLINCLVQLQPPLITNLLPDNYAHRSADREDLWAATRLRATKMLVVWSRSTSTSPTSDGTNGSCIQPATMPTIVEANAICRTQDTIIPPCWASSATSSDFVVHLGKWHL